jgi:hypothetical protein
MSEPKGNPEDEYFAREDAAKKSALKDAADAEAARAAREAARQLHHQRCGKCGGAMSPRPFRGVEIDVCGGCGAVLLDPGELETLAGTDQGGIVQDLARIFRFGGS